VRGPTMVRSLMVMGAQSLKRAPAFTNTQAPSRTCVPNSTSKGGWTMQGPSSPPNSACIARKRPSRSSGGSASSAAFRPAQAARAAKKTSWEPS